VRACDSPNPEQTKTHHELAQAHLKVLAEARAGLFYDSLSRYEDVSNDDVENTRQSIKTDGSSFLDFIHLL
jgi:hypothetical protein